jgi:aminopeptidase-like protein
MSGHPGLPIGVRMMQLAERLYPICRSITGNGVRQTLAIIGEQIPLAVQEVPSGAPVFDWIVPPEWNLQRATLRGPDGSMLADTDVHNLHVLNYSIPYQGSVSLEELRPHLFSLPNRPDDIPYRTSYYKPAWGFCLPHRVVELLKDGDYAVDIETVLAPGSLTYGECVLPGESEDEIVLSAHVCHPSLANDNLSGISVAVEIARAIAQRRRRYTYRFLFAPGTIGAITWLAMNRSLVHRIRHGLILSCVGDAGGVTYKQSRQGDAAIDRVTRDVLTARGGPHEIRPFLPYGYDERQFCSPGFDLPFGVLMRTPYGEFAEYHTSSDNCSLLKPAALVDSVETVLSILDQIESEPAHARQLPPADASPQKAGDAAAIPMRDNCRRFRNLLPFCEPQLGRRGLYATMGGTTKSAGYEMALLWMLNLSDGAHDLQAISQRAALPVAVLLEAADALRKVQLLKEITPASAADRSAALPY